MFTYEFICCLILCLGAFNVMSAGAFFFLVFAIRNFRDMFLNNTDNDIQHNLLPRKGC